MKKYCFIYNPAANRNRSDNRFRKLLAILDTWPDEIRVINSNTHGEIRNLSGEVATSHDVVVACGGDGTTRDVAAGLLNTKTKLGILPMGSGNDFAKSVGVPVNLEDALSVLRSAQSKPVDMGKCNDILFLNTLGFGFDGLANRLACESSVSSANLRYSLSALKACRIIKSFHAEVTARHINVNKQVFMVTFANGRVEGGRFCIMPDASPHDGRIDLLMVEQVPGWVLPFLLSGFLTGRQKRLPYINYYEEEKYHLQIDRPVPVHADGEIITFGETEFVIEAVPAAVQVIGKY